jgi:branched-chain amino acid transport system substrate-binding protein
MLGRRAWLGGSVGLGMASVVGGCGEGGSAAGGAPGGAAGGAAGEWRIGAYLSLSGAQTQFGVDTKEGIELAIDELNKAGGVKGKPLKVLFEDDQSKPDVANNKVLQLIDRDKVVALLGEVASSISKAGGIVANKKGIPMITPSSTNPDVTKVGDYVFRVCFVDDFQGQMGAEFAVKTLGKKKIALLFAEDDLYSSGLATEFKKAAKELGAEIVVEKKFTKAETNFTTYLSEVKAASPEIIYAPVYYNQMSQISRQAKAEGIAGDMFVGGDGWSDQELFKELQGGYFTDHYAPNIPWAKSKAFVAAYEARYKRLPTSLAAMGYDAALVLADAIKRAKGDTPKDIRDAIAQTKDFAGATGNITIDANRNAVKAAVIVQINNGTTEYKTIVGPGAEILLAGGPAASAAAPATSAPSAAPATSASTAPATSASAPPAGSASSAPAK